MEIAKGIVKLTRKQIYDEAWEVSVAGVARKYNLNYARLIALCKESKIPFPPSGYWTRRNMGKDVSSEIIPLGGDGDEILELITNDSVVKRLKKQKTEPIIDVVKVETSKERQSKTEQPQVVPKQEKAESDMSNILTFLHEEERKEVIMVALSLEVNEEARLHKALVQYKKRIAEYNEKLKAAQSQSYYNPRYNKPAEEPPFFKEVSEEGSKRFMSILNALFFAVEKLGGTVNDDLSVKIRSDIVRFRIAEGQDKVKHELTKQEAQELIKYQDAIKRHSWASKPQIRQYDQVYNGKIRIIFGTRNYIRDAADEKLEDRLAEILFALYELSEENRIERERREEEQRKREEEARKREELRKRKEIEIEQTKMLANKAEDYRIASEIRSYINAMIENSNPEATSEWVEWARQKADWYDPTIAKEDEFLGKREHGKSKEEKELDKNQTRRNWYW